MAARKIRDIAVKTGEYTDSRTGKVKGKWQNVGALMRGDDGGEFIILERWFNPAGLPDPQNRGSVLLSCFPLRDRDQDQDDRRPSQQQAASQPSAGDYDDDIPF